MTGNSPHGVTQITADSGSSCEENKAKHQCLGLCVWPLAKASSRGTSRADCQTRLSKAPAGEMRSQQVSSVVTGTGGEGSPKASSGPHWEGGASMMGIIGSRQQVLAREDGS